MVQLDAGTDVAEPLLCPQRDLAGAREDAGGGASQHAPLEPGYGLRPVAAEEADMGGLLWRCVADAGDDAHVEASVASAQDGDVLQRCARAGGEVSKLQLCGADLLWSE